MNYNDPVYDTVPNLVRPKSGAEGKMELNSGPENGGTLYGHETIITPQQNQIPTPAMSITKSLTKLQHPNDHLTLVPHEPAEERGPLQDHWDAPMKQLPDGIINQVDFLQIQNKHRSVLRQFQLHKSESNINTQVNRNQVKEISQKLY